ncbi:hypothetical protein ACLB2K_038400 [Fragaria x ananassa]
MFNSPCPALPRGTSHHIAILVLLRGFLDSFGSTSICFAPPHSSFLSSTGRLVTSSPLISLPLLVSLASPHLTLFASLRLTHLIRLTRITFGYHASHLSCFGSPSPRSASHNLAVSSPPPRFAYYASPCPTRVALLRLLLPSLNVP